MRYSFKNILLNPIISLNTIPIFYHGKNSYLVGFGIFGAVAAFIAMSLFIAYLVSKNISLNYPLAMWLIVGAFFIIIFSKFFHVLVVGKDFFITPVRYLRQTVFYNQGGQIGVLMAALLISYFENINLWVILDGLCYAFCAALIIGRLGCYNYGCCFGRITRSRFAVTYNNPESKVLRIHPELKGKPLVPTQLISAAFNLLLFLLLTAIYFFEPKDGLLALIFFAIYNAFRIIIHQFRANDTNHNKLKDDQIFLITSFIFTIFGVLGLVLSILYYDFLPKTAIVTPLGFKLYILSLISDPICLISLILITLACIYVYGYHHKKLGQHI